MTSLKFMYLHIEISFIYIILIRLFFKLLILLVCVCKPQSYVNFDTSLCRHSLWTSIFGPTCVHTQEKIIMLALMMIVASGMPMNTS